jgi:hypothetical protein
MLIGSRHYVWIYVRLGQNLGRQSFLWRCLPLIKFMCTIVKAFCVEFGGDVIGRESLGVKRSRSGRTANQPSGF